MKFSLSILLLLISGVIFSQKRYKFTYEIHLKNIPSTYTVTYDTTRSSTCTKIIAIAAVNDTIVQSSIKIHGNGLDTVLHTGHQYLQTIAKIVLKPGEYDMEIYDIEHTPLKAQKINIRPYVSTIITAKMGYKNDLQLGSIYSKRKLTQPEIDKIIEEYSNRREPELIKNKTCLVSWQI